MIPGHCRARGGSPHSANHRGTMAEPSDLEDYSPLLEEHFSAHSFANDLLLATNPTHSELDISTALKRVKFDVNNINLQLDKIASENHESIIKEMNRDKDTKDLFKQLDQPLTHINTSYQRLEKDLLQPYTQAAKTQEALKKIYWTSHILRSLTYFLHLINQIEDTQQNPSFEQTMIKNPKNLLRICNFHNQLKTHVKENPELKSLKIIRDYEAIGGDKQRRLREFIQSQIRSITERNIGQYDEATIKIYFQALHLLEPNALYNTIQTIMSHNVSNSVNSLTRVLTSPRNFEAAMGDVVNKALFLTKITDILDNTSPATQQQTTQSLLGLTMSALEITNVLSAFWRDVAKNYEGNFRETIQRGGPVAKSIIGYKDQIRTAIKRGVLKSSDMLKGEGIEVKMMMNSVAALDRSRY